MLSGYQKPLSLMVGCRFNSRRHYFLIKSINGLPAGRPFSLLEGRRGAPDPTLAQDGSEGLMGLDFDVKLTQILIRYKIKSSFWSAIKELR
jgi:hypothetical protein